MVGYDGDSGGCFIGGEYVPSPEERVRNYQRREENARRRATDRKREEARAIAVTLAGGYAPKEPCPLNMPTTVESRGISYWLAITGITVAMAAVVLAATWVIRG